MSAPFIVPVRDNITGLVLAGGRGTRMGGADKGLLPWRNRTMIEHVIDALKPSVRNILISANRNLERYSEFGYRVIPDARDDYPGPLAGILRGLEHAATEYIVTAPCDSPLISALLVSRLVQTLTREQTDIAVAHDGARLQPAFLLLRRELCAELGHYLDSGAHKLETWVTRQRHARADFSDNALMFANINSFSDRAALMGDAGNS